jgi:hypothetical protein
MLKWLSVFTVLLFMIGCVPKPSAYEMAQADYGQVPDSYEGLITHKLKEILPDSQSATIEVSRPYPAVRSLGSLNGGGYEYGHVVHAWVTPKNESESFARKSSKIFWWSHTGWSTMLPSLDGVTPKYPEQAEEYAGGTFVRN